MYTVAVLKTHDRPDWSAVSVIEICIDIEPRSSPSTSTFMICERTSHQAHPIHGDQSVTGHLRSQVGTCAELQ